MNLEEILKSPSVEAAVEHTGSNGHSPKASDQFRRITIRDMSQAMQPQGERKWRVKGLLAEGNVAVLSAWTGSGKTWVAYELAVSHALGCEWMGFETVQGTSLIINEEMDEYDLNLRLAMCNRAKFGDEQTPVKMVSFARFNLYLERSAVNDAALIEQTILETKAQLVIIDALADLMVGGNENSVEDTQPVFMKLSEIAKRTKCAITVIHHTGKNGTTRGSSAIPGAADLVVLAKRTPDSPYLNFETEKERMISKTIWTGKMVWTPDQFYTERMEKQEPVQRISPGDQLSEKEKAIITFLESCDPPQATTKQITQETGASRYIVMKLSRKGKIQRVDEGVNGEEATYKLSNIDL